MSSSGDYYDYADWGFYFCFGAAICANFQGLLISTVLLKKNWRRNIVIVIANICYLISNWISFGQSTTENCTSTGYAVQIMLIFGSLFEAHTPLLRAFSLLTPRWKKAAPILSAIMIIAQFCTLIGVQFICDSEEHQFMVVVHRRSADAVASLFAIYIYILSFSKIIQVIDTSQFGKSNGRMKVIRTLSKYSMLFAIAMRVVIALFDIGRLDKNGKVVMAMRSNIVVFLMATQLCLELSKLSSDGSEYSDSDSITGANKGTGSATGHTTSKSKAEHRISAMSASSKKFHK
eukprot:NODE_35_length_36362_cov_0.944434.p15 type:complete len:290 gc:universal NODE_35_length_36362_cov_0.944434:15045-15914(+)